MHGLSPGVRVGGGGGGVKKLCILGSLEWLKAGASVKKLASRAEMACPSGSWRTRVSSSPVTSLSPSAQVHEVAVCGFLL
jgi:hypothetical protein